MAANPQPVRVLKLVHHDGQCRRLACPDSFAELVRLVESTAHSSGFCLPKLWCLQYLDDEQDMVLLSNQAEFEEALDHRSGPGALKVFVLEQVVREQRVAARESSLDSEDDFLLVDLETKSAPPSHQSEQRQRGSQQAQVQRSEREEPQTPAVNAVKGTGQDDAEEPQAVSQVPASPVRTRPLSKPMFSHAAPISVPAYSRSSTICYAGPAQMPAGSRYAHGNPKVLYASAGSSNPGTPYTSGRA